MCCTVVQAYGSKCELIWGEYLWHGERHLWFPHLSFLSQVYKKIYLSLVLDRHLITWKRKRKKMHLRAGWTIASTATSFTSMASTVSQALTFPFTRQFLVARHLMQWTARTRELKNLHSSTLLINSIEAYMTSYKTNIRGIACSIIYLVNLEEWKMRNHYLTNCYSVR